MADSTRSVVVCASGRFKLQVQEAATQLRECGWVVYEPPLHNIEKLCEGGSHELFQLAWKGATYAHFERIRKADFVLFVNPGGYLGNGTTLELGFGTALGKTIVAMREDAVEPARNVLIDFVLGDDEIRSAMVKFADQFGRG